MKKKKDELVLLAVKVPKRTKKMIEDIAKKDQSNSSVVVRQALKKFLPRKYSKV